MTLSALHEKYHFTKEAQLIVDAFEFSFFFVMLPKPEFEWVRRGGVYGVTIEGKVSYGCVYFEISDGVIEYEADSALGKDVPQIDERYTWEFVKKKEEAFQMLFDFYNGKAWGDNYAEHLKMVAR